jgi:serine protease inhibitor
VSEISHSARLTTDEEGVTAAAFTAITAPGAAPPSDDLAVFVFDRPFVMVVTGRSGTPLLIAGINVPND